MTIEFMKGVQCAESTKPTLYTVIMNEKEKSPSPMRKNFTKSFAMHWKKKSQMMNKDQKKRKRKTREKKCKQKVDNRNCVKTKETWAQQL